LGIVVGGIGLASLLGQPGSPPRPETPEAEDVIVLRRRAGREDFPAAATLAEAGSESAVLSIPAFPSLPDSPPAVRAERPDPLPPTLAKAFPTIEETTSARWGTSLGIGLSGAGLVAPSPRRHKIVNGDSLPALAKRYLGSEDRAEQIFEANRDLLSSPDALPIGIELRIPPPDPPKPATTAAPLVPIAPRDPGKK
jgi:nucleoid-associated protein YgaU